MQKIKSIPILLAAAVAASITFTIATPLNAQPAEVWVDDDWAGCSPLDPVDGHIFGTDAFATIQAGMDAVRPNVITIEASRPGAQDMVIFSGFPDSTTLIGDPKGMESHLEL